MSKGMLIAGNESALFAAIETEASKRAEPYALALIPDRFSANSPKAGTPPGQNALDWNPGSPISARTLIVAAQNRFSQIGEAILVCDPPQARCAAADLVLADIEVLVNDHVKGWFFLARELAAVFRAQGEGTLALVFPESGGSGGKDDASGLLGQTALGAFRSLTQNLLAAALSEPYAVMGFSGSDAGDEAGFAAFIFKQLDDRNRRGNGKLHKYGKLGFFR